MKRRTGTTASFDVINKYFSISSMPIVSSTYWNHVYGRQPEDVIQDKEGLMTMCNIGKNMAWLLKCIKLGRDHGLTAPENEKVLTDLFGSVIILEINTGAMITQLPFWREL